MNTITWTEVTEDQHTRTHLCNGWIDGRKVAIIEAWRQGDQNDVMWNVYTDAPGSLPAACRGLDAAKALAEAHAQEYSLDLIPHCIACEDNPAAEGDELCLPCAQTRDAQPVRQENAENPFRAGRGNVLMLPAMCEETEAAFMEEFSRLPLPRDQHPVIDYAWPESSAQAHRESCKKELLAKLHANAHCDRRTCPHCQEERATFTHMDDGYRKQAFFARAVTLFALALALIAGTGNASAAETLTSPGGHAFPFIGTPAYSDSCTITHTWEDGSAIAYCTEDGASYVYDPDGQYVPNIPNNPVHEPGWYVWEGGAS